MTPLHRLEQLDQQLTELQQHLPRLQPDLPGPQMRRQLFNDLADFWSDTTAPQPSRREQLQRLRRQQLLAEIELRLADQTLHDDHIALLRTCLELPLGWQRNHLPAASRPHILRPVFSTLSPNRRLQVPGLLVLVAGTFTGSTADPAQTLGKALLCSLGNGVEAFASLAELHQELCEHIDDPVQGQSLLGLLGDPQQREQLAHADRLRYEHCDEDLVQYQAQAVVDVQQQRLTQAWTDAWQHGVAPDSETLGTALTQALELAPLMDSRHALATRYALLLEKHLPAWQQNASPQALSHVMQTLQALAAAITQAAAPGILTLEQFRQRDTLLGWTRQRLRERLRRDPGLNIAPEDIQINVTLARQVGPLVNPLQPSAYIAVSSNPPPGGNVELVQVTYQLDELALYNIAWFDTDYWLTARVQHKDGTPLPSLTAQRVKAMVRELDAGSGYQRHLRRQLLDSPEGAWRQWAHGLINRARMHAELVKARYAGHLLPDPFERSYHWGLAVIGQPVPAEVPQLTVRQLVIQGHTVQGVLLIDSAKAGRPALLLYTPDAPDRRPWRDYRNTRALLKALRASHKLRDYVSERMPQANAAQVDKLLRKGRLGPQLATPAITGELFTAVYRAEVHALLAEVDAGTRSNRELLGETGVNALRLLLDLVGLVLPFPALSALAFGRTAISIWDGFEAMRQDDREAALHHALGALSHSIDGINSFAGSAVLRRAFRGLPHQPPLPLSHYYVARPELSRLRLRNIGLQGDVIYEMAGTAPGVPQYFIRDKLGRHFQVAFDGQRWRAIDPRQPDAYLKLPLRRQADGEWVVDSALRWHDGLPDLRQLLEDCRLPETPGSTEVSGEESLFDDGGQLQLQVGPWRLPVRRHLLAGHYHLKVAASTVQVWVVLRKVDEQWRIRVRQAGLSSEWLAIPG